MMPSDYQKMNKVQFNRYLIAKGFSAKSIQSMLVVFNQYLQWLVKENMEIAEISYNDLLLFMKHCQHKGMSQRTIKHYIIVVRHFYDYLVSETRIAINPVINITIKGIKRKVLYHILDPHELQILYNSYQDDSPKGIRSKVMLGLLVNQGLKTEELAKLQVKDIDLRAGKIIVPGGRKSNGREMQLASHQVMELYEYVLQARKKIQQLPPKRKQHKPQETEQLFIAEGGHKANFSNYMTQLMIKLRKINPSILNAKQACLSVRQIRASVITKWLKQYNLREAQYLAGHRFISSTESYLENDVEELKEEVQQFHPLG